MSTVHNENTQFVDSVTGELINNGYVYFGDPGVDPVLNPKDVYDNRQLTGAALANPQRTGSDGRLLNKVWVDGKYSMKVTDSAGTQKLLDLDRGEIAQAGNSILINSLGTNDVTATGSPTITTLTDNQTYIFSAPAANTGAMTLAIDAIAAKPIKKAHDAAIESGDIKADQKIVVVYNSTDDWFEIQSNVLNSVFSGNVSVGQDIVLTEQADHASTPAAGSGYLWVKDDTPSKLKFTDDAGTDHNLITPLNTKVIDIGDWNMDSTASLTVAHGLTLSKIRNIDVLIRSDADTTYYTGYIFLETITVNATDVSMGRPAGGTLDSTGFDSTSFNRGWITIQYTD